MPAGTAPSSTTTMPSPSRHSPSGSCRAPGQARRARRGRAQLHRSRARRRLCRSAGLLPARARRARALLPHDLQRAVRATPAAQQDEVITALEQGKATGFTWPSAQAFFNTVRTHTMEGMFADPIYGGNKDFAGWRLVGFPGAQPAVHPGGYAEQGGVRGAPIIGLQASPKPRREEMSHGNRKDRCCHRRRRRGRRHPRGRTRQGGHEGDRVERGPRLTTQDFNPHDELRYFQRQDLRPNIKREPVTWRPNTDARAKPIPVLNNGYQAGGGTVHYGAVSWRMHEDDFRARSTPSSATAPRRFRTDSSLADWPLSYADLEPFYDRAEYELGVSGKAGNLQARRSTAATCSRPAPSRLSPAAVQGRTAPDSCSTPPGETSAITRSRPACHHLQPSPGPARLRLLRLLQDLGLSCRREVVDPCHQAAQG